MVVQIYSYGAKHNEPSLATTVFDRVYPCHNIINPYTHGMKAQTGMDEDVQVLVWSDAVAKQHYRMAMREITEEGFTSIAFECFGGKHRSVAMVEILAEGLRDLGYDVNVQHLSLGRH